MAVGAFSAVDLLAARALQGTGAAMAALFAYVSGSSFVFQQEYHLSQQVFGVVFGAGAAGMITATQLNVRLLRRYSPAQILISALAFGALMGLTLLLFAATGFGGGCGIVLPLIPRLGFGFQMATDNRYTVFTVLLHIAVVGLALEHGGGELPARGGDVVAAVEPTGRDRTGSTELNLVP